MTEDLSSLLGKLIEEAEGENSVPANNSIPASAMDGGGLFGSLLSNPEMLSRLPTIMNAASGFLGGGKGGGRHGGHHTALLCALKPYLNSDRQRAAEYMINFLRIEEAFRSIPQAPATGKKEIENVQQSIEQ
ncbi:MAG: hypothetical protein E7589_00150 [Ruminococcaceae bacterium]|nr:hypothetical protein [Oscillospiraceae bacterium]